MTGIAKSAVELDAFSIGNLASSNLAWITHREELNSDPRGCDLAKFFWQCQGDGVWRTLFTPFNDTRGYLEIWGGDAASMDRQRYSFAITTPAYGVSDWDLEEGHDGGWNTGGFGVRLIANGNNFQLEFQFSSYYSTSNTGSFFGVWRGVYG